MSFSRAKVMGALLSAAAMLGGTAQAPRAPMGAEVTAQAQQTQKGGGTQTVTQNVLRQLGLRSDPYRIIRRRTAVWAGRAKARKNGKARWDYQR